MPFGQMVLAQGKTKIPTIDEATKELDTRAIRTRTNEVFTRMAGNVEELADGIFMGSDNPVIANRALLWKIGSISAAQHSFFDNDPIISMLDAYAFSKQQHHFFTVGKGRDLFGPWQTEVNAHAAQLLSVMEDMIRGLCVDRNYECAIIANIDNWAEDNTINSLYFNRKSIIENLAELVGPFKAGIGKSVVEMTESLQDMSSRMNIYSQFLPKQMRWEMQLVLVQLEMKNLIDTSMSTMSQLNAMSGIMPGKMDSLLTVSLSELHLITGIATASIGNERLAMQHWGSGLTDSLTLLMLNESNRWENIVNEQREMAMLGANDIVSASADPVNEMIDHAFWRGVQLLLIAVVLFVLALWVNRKLK